MQNIVARISLLLRKFGAPSRLLSNENRSFYPRSKASGARILPLTSI